MRSSSVVCARTTYSMVLRGTGQGTRDHHSRSGTTRCALGTVCTLARVQHASRRHLPSGPAIALRGQWPHHRGGGQSRTRHQHTYALVRNTTSECDNRVLGAQPSWQTCRSSDLVAAMVAGPVVPCELAMRSNGPRRHDADRDYVFAVQLVRHQTGVCEFIHCELILHEHAIRGRVLPWLVCQTHRILDLVYPAALDWR